MKSKALARITGLSVGMLNKMSPEDFDGIFLLAICKSREEPPPEQRMGHRAFLTWCAAEYEKYGEMLKDVDLGHTLDWSRTVGLIRLQQQGGLNYTKLMCTRTGEVVDMPKNMSISDEDVHSGVWQVQHNTCL